MTILQVLKIKDAVQMDFSGQNLFPGKAQFKIKPSANPDLYIIPTLKKPRQTSHDFKAFLFSSIYYSTIKTSCL